VYIWILRRLGSGLIVIASVMVIVFLLLRILPGDPVALIAPNARPEEKENLRLKLGLKDPIHIQLLNYLNGLAHGDLGDSVYSGGKPVATLIAEAFPNTVRLSMLALVCSYLLFLPLGLLVAIKKDTLIDRLISSLAVVLQSFPGFWVGILLIAIFAVNLKWFPAVGYKGPKYLVLPAITIALSLVATIIRNTRLNMISIMMQDYIKAARARGVPRSSVILKHALKNSSLAILTMFGLQLGTLLSGAIVVEWVFGYPGVGLLTILAVVRRDYPLVQALAILLSGLFVIINIIVDVTYTIVDPRLRKASAS
jgi:peptide/nickel transport system permease protein